MDLLYSRYASPFEFMGIYIGQGRFGEFVDSILKMDIRRKRETAWKDNEDKLWLAYIHSITDQTYADWKESLKQEKEPVSYAMSDKQAETVKQQAREILRKIQPV
ncbi:hypothetical protein IMSAGC009_04067 [Lachnospiraceae bacterium]|nr:hypothetical protein IMSAGC009_04067 [Lachnospiraceae bacterium]